MFFVLCANNTDTNIGIVSVSMLKSDAWAHMYAAFVAGLKEAFPNHTPPSAEEAEKGCEYNLYSSRASITEDGASICDGDDMTYYSIVEQEVPLFRLDEEYADIRTADSVTSVFFGETSAKKAMRNAARRVELESPGATVKKGDAGIGIDCGDTYFSWSVKPLEIQQ